MDPTKGLFRRRPSSASTRSRLRPQASTGGVSTTASCPTSPKHTGSGGGGQQATAQADSSHTAGGSRRSLGEQRIPEDEEAHLIVPTTSTEASEYAAAIEASRKEAQERQQLQRSPSRNSTRSTRVSSAGSRLTGNGKQQQQQQQSTSSGSKTRGNDSAVDRGGSGGCSGSNNLQRSASTISGLAVRPRSSPGGLHSYTGSVPSSVHGSRVDLRDTDKGSAVYLGCTAPRTSTLSLASSGSSAPASPARTPPVSPRHGNRRATSLMKKQR